MRELLYHWTYNPCSFSSTSLAKVDLSMLFQTKQVCEQALTLNLVWKVSTWSTWHALKGLTKEARRWFERQLEIRSKGAPPTLRRRPSDSEECIARPERFRYC